jgi:hypothetical protein
MNPYKVSCKDFKEIPVKTTPDNVQEANKGLFYSKMNLPQAAKHCGMSQKEMRLTFFEYLKYHPIEFET